MSYHAIAGVPSVKLTKAEQETIRKAEETEAVLIAKFGPDCFAFRDLMDDLDRKGLTDLVLHPLVGDGQTVLNQKVD